MRTALAGQEDTLQELEERIVDVLTVTVISPNDFAKVLFEGRHVCAVHFTKMVLRMPPSTLYLVGTALDDLPRFQSPFL
jgi:hypothetical protein